MAQVDFTNARISPYTGNGIAPSSPRVNPTRYSYVTLTSSTEFLDASGNRVSQPTKTTLKNAQKQFVILYNGTFTASGTEFYIVYDNGGCAGWKVSNISFSSGDTYVFSIKADLICQ